MRDDELQRYIRAAAAVVLLGSFALIVVVAILMPFLTDREANTTLLLGLATASLTAAGAMLGVSIVINRRNGS